MKPVAVVPVKEKKKDQAQNITPTLPVSIILQQVNSENIEKLSLFEGLQDEKSALYLFVDAKEETKEKTIDFIVSLSCLSRWHDAPIPESTHSTPSEKPIRHSNGSNEKLNSDINIMKHISKCSTLQLTSSEILAFHLIVKFHKRTFYRSRVY